MIVFARLNDGSAIFCKENSPHSNVYVMHYKWWMRDVCKFSEMVGFFMRTKKIMYYCKLQHLGSKKAANHPPVEGYVCMYLYVCSLWLLNVKQTRDYDL